MEDALLLVGDDLNEVISAMVETPVLIEMSNEQLNNVAFALWMADRPNTNPAKMVREWKAKIEDNNVGEAYLNSYRNKAICAISAFTGEIQNG